MFSSYSRLATEVYDIDKPVGHSFGDIDYYRERLKEVKGRILEPGTGSGRIYIPLLQDGLNIEGIDQSPEMLDSCKMRCEERGLSPVLHEMDMSEMKLQRTYEAIIIPAGTFLLIEDRKKSILALKNFYDHLAAGGRLILDLYLQPEAALNEVKTKTWVTPEQNVITMESKRVEVNFLEQYSVSYLKYEKWQDGKLIDTELQRFAMRWYGVREFKLVLERLGFTDIVISADYTYGKAPVHADQTITFEARKPESTYS
ncbi:class I SAM-dependent methyltransferase [Peribacillus frigoritolerans]|uniref:class I SAM-dependent methyltransferase n=1 Tax=Peribacillus frigoritolerans TaxID=450367 RepID=UPI00105A654B|nr:class I SAM-dependent methyltransferase [Peribacillus frigoritolerans]TDL75929.1 class I SAM-dependent methyltransferase [Peribacillus frigoritolerans]